MREPARERSATFGVQRFEPVFKTHETLARSRQRLDAFVMDPVQQEIVNGILKARTKGSDGFKIVADQPEESSSSSQKFGDIFYYDVASGALVLTSQDAPVACVAFNIYDKASLLDIRQIQGVQGRQDDLRRIGNWDIRLARVAIQLARFLELSEVAIQPSDQNSWLIKPGEVDPTTHRLTPMQAAKRYDAFAKQLGFTHDTVKFPPRWLYPIDPEKRKDLNSQEKDAQPTGVNTADLPRIRTRTLFRRPGD